MPERGTFCLQPRLHMLSVSVPLLASFVVPLPLHVKVMRDLKTLAVRPSVLPAIEPHPDYSIQSPASINPALTFTYALKRKPLLPVPQQMQEKERIDRIGTHANEVEVEGRATVRVRLRIKGRA